MEVPNFKKSRLSQLVAHGLIISGRGGSKGGGSSRTPVEANDTVNSRAMASVLDLLGEGVIGGLIDGAKSIFLNDTPLQNSDNSYNFSGVTWWFRDGSQDQSVIDGFDFIETPKSVGRQLKQTSQVNVSLDSADSDRVRVVMKFPSLRSIDKKSGDTNGTTVQFKFQIDAGNGGGFVDVVAEGESNATISLTAKKTGVYYRSYVLDLPKPAKSYTLRAIRLTEDHKDDSYLYDDTYIDSIGEIVNTSLNYPNSALVGLKINSEQFGSTMPSRSYLIKGLKIRVPSNYNADTNSYDGNWDGTFKLASSSNPAWILFDLLTNTRYGLGEFVKESMINIGELYQIGRYCDAFVDDGFGGKEKRFAINTQITSRQDAYRVVQDIAGAFRGMVYWAGGMVHITQDSPADPVMLFSNSNVVNGSFAYKGSARKDRYSVALITYNNKEDGYKQSVEYVEDQEAIKRYGIRKTESVAFGCTSRGQAHRVGLWTLYTSRMESDVITFAVGMDSVFLMPGDIVLIADKFRAGRRNSGRIIGYTSNSIKLDAPVDLTSVGNHITFLSAEGKMVERDILENGKNITTVTFKAALSSNETPVNDAVWVIAQPDLTPLQARVVSVAEGDDGTSFNITAIQNNPTKYEAIDSGAQLIPQNTTVLDPTFSKPSGLAITEGTYLSSPGNLSVSLTATWQGKSAQYYISWRRSDAGNVSNWKSERVTEEQFELRGVAENGQYDFQVYAVSVGGRKTDPISITYKVLGTLSAPDAPTGLTAVGDYRSIVLNWINPSSVDLDHVEVLASTINDKSKAQLIAKVSGTTFTHNGLEDSVTWYYWVRAANKRGMLSALNSPLATVATTRDVLSFLQNKITESELGQDLIADINSKAVATEVDAAIDEAKSETKAQVDDARTEAANAVKSAKEALSTAIDKETQDRAQAIANETTARNKAIADEASIRATAISNEVTARTNAIAAEVGARTKAVADEATARNKAIAAEADARAKAVSDEAAARASAITDSVAIEASNRAKAVSDATAALDTKISKEASDRASAISALDIKTANAINTETLNRISSIEGEARARADALLQEKNNRQSEISNLSTQVQTVNESLAQQISQIAAGTGEQFDSLKIWYFDTNSEGWTEDDGSTVPMAVTDDGWLKSSNSTASCRSPNNMVIDANAYRFLKLRIKKVGKPTWSGKLYWIGASEQGWSESRSLVIDEPEYDANGVATLTIHDIDWRASTTIRRFRFDFLKNQSDTNNLLIDWIAVGRPTPGAGMAALQDEKSARVDADAAEAANRNALAVQMRGSYEGNDLSKVGSGLIFQEQLARVTADKAEAMARQSLETKVDDSVSNINKSLDTLNTQDKAMASDITGLKSSLKDKADASALQTLKTSVDQQGSSISTQGQSITKLQNDLSTTNANVSKKADQTALTALQGTVTQQGKDISAANSSITNLKTSLDTTNSNVAKKADATAVNDLTSRVSATEGKVSSQADSIVQLNNSLSNAIADSDVSTKTPNNLIVNPSFERGTDGYIGVSSLSSVITIQVPHSGTKALMVAPGNSAAPGQYVDFVKDRTYEIGVWVKQISGTTDNGSGNNKLRVGSTAGNPVFELPFTGVSGEWTKFSRRWKATETASLPVTLSNYLTAGNRYFDDFYVIDVTDSVNIDANASALSSLQNTVTQQGKDISSQSTSITSLNNSLKTTNDNVAKKADSSTVQTLQNTVTQQGKDISTATSNISSLKSGLATTDGNVAKKADASALQSLQNTVTQQGKDLTSVGSRTTALENSLKATNDNVATKADASSLSTLQNTVSQQGKDITSASDAITSLNNSVGAMTNMGDNLIQDANLEGDGSAFRTQQNSGTTGSIVAFGAYGENSAGARMLKVNATSPGLFANGKKPTPVNGSRKFRYVVRAKGVSGPMNMLLRRWNFNGAAEGNYEDKNVTLTSDWQTITWDTSFSPSTGADGQAFGIYCHPSNAEIWIDSFQVFDITDAVNNDATASALSDLSTKVTKQGDTVSSQGTSITKLQNDLTSTKTDVSKKADASALQTLQNTVVEQGKTLTSQGSSLTTLNNTVNTVKGDVAKKADTTALNDLTTRVTNTENGISSNSGAITSLNNSLNQQSKRGANILPDGTFESYSNGYNLSNNRVIVTTDDAQGGSKCIRVTRPNDYNPNATDNSDNHIFGSFQVRDNAVFYLEYWVKLDANKANMAANTQITVGLSVQYQDNSWQWPSLTKTVKDLSSTSWTKVSGYLKLSKSGVKQAMARISVPNVSTVKAGDSFLNDNIVLTEVTDAYNAQELSNANASAIQTLNSTVDKNGSDIASQGSAITKLQNDLGTTNANVSKKAEASALQSLQNTVTDQGKTLTSQGSSLTSLNNTINTVKDDVAKKADASALQTLQSTVTQQGKDITSANSRITSLTNGLATTDSNVAKKADATALSSLQNTVTQQGKDIASTTNNLDSLSNQLTNGKVNTWSRRIYKLQLASNATEPTFSDIQGLSPYLADEVADAAKLDFASFGSYVIAHYKAFVRVDADTKITMSPGSRVFDDSGAVYVNDARAAAGGANTGSIGIMLKAGWNTVEFLVNQWTGQAYVNLGLKISDNVKEMYSVMGVAALSSAISEVSSNVSRVGDTVTSNSSDITKLANSLASTDANVAKKADSSALSSLQNTVTQQGNTLSSQGNSITSLQNSLSTTDGKVAKKAEQSAVDSLTGRVTKTENDITAANISVTSLNAAIRAGNASSGDLIPNPTFDVQYDSMGFTVISTDSAGVPAGCPFKYAAKLAARDHHPNFNTIVATVGDVFEISALVACGAGSADFNLYIGTANGPTGGVASPLYAGGNTKTTSTWKRVTWKVTVPQSAVDKGYLRPFLQINQSSPFGTVWYVTDWHMRNITAAAAAQSTADATSKAVDSLTSTVTQQGKDVSSVSARATALENGLSTANTNIGKKADASALQTLQNTVTQQGKDLSTQSDSLTNLSNSLSNVSVGGTNLISLSGTMDGWGSKISETFRGNAVCGATTKAGGSYRDLKEVIIDAPVDNAEYVYSFYAKGGVNGQSMTVFFYNPNTTESSETSQGVKASNTDGRAAFTLTTEWVRYWVKWKQKPGTGAKRLIIARIEASTTTDQTVYVSSPKMEVGNMPTEWSPAPADLAASADLSSLQTTVAANSSSIQSVTSRVSNVEGTVSSQGTALTSLQNSLNTTNSNVSKKADASALQTLQNTVTQQGNDISGQGSRVTSLENNLTAGANLIPNPAMLNGAQGWGGSATTVDGYAAVVSSSGWGPSSSYFQVTPGDIIDLSLMSQSAGAASISWGLRFDGPGLSNFCLYAPALTFAAGEKKSVSAAITVPAGATKAMFQASARATSARTVYNIIATRRDAGTKANSSAIDTLNSTVKTQGDTLSSIGSRTTSLENGLNSANSALSLKADASALSSLTNTVTQQGKDLDAAEANITAANTSITSMQASLTRRTVFTITSRGVGSSAKDGIFDESGVKVFTPGRSYALVTFKANSDGSTSIDTSKTYDVFGSANNGKTMSDDIAALANGVYACVMTFDEPTGSRSSVYAAVELLGGTSEVLASLPYRGAYILLGRKGMKAGDGLELRAPTGGDQSAFVSTSVEFVNGVMMGLGAAGGVMMKADANASAITTLQNTVTQQGKDITSSSSAITSLQNGLVAANSNIDKKADATALQSLQNTVTQQGKDISTQSGNVTNLQNSLSATNTGLANLVADSDASKKIVGNLLTNSSFERGLEGFSGGASFIKVIDAQSPNSGSKILSCGAGTGTVSQSIAVTKDRTYKIGVFARCQSGSVVDNQSNNKLRIGNSSPLIDFQFKPTDLPTDSTWKEISGTWKATVSDRVGISINSSLKSGNQYFDDFYFIDITDIVNIDAASNAVASLTSRVTSAEGTVSSHTGSITNLSNSLNSLNNTVSGKADASALQSLQNTVTQQGKDLSSASGSVTDLKSSLNTLKVQTNPWIDGTFETYDNNQQLGGSTAIVTTDFKSSGSKCLKVTRPANTSGNSDKMIGPYSAVRQSAKYRVEFWAMMPAAEAPPSGWSVAVGLHSINKDGGNDWQGITFNEAGLGGRDQWVKFTGVVKVSPSVTRSHVWISTRGQSGSNTPGYAVYIDDFVITDITDAADAQATADANATAISSLQTKVSDIDGKVTAQTSQLSSMQSKVDASSSRVDQLSKTISDSQSTQASLNTSLQSQIDAQASANIKNQADLNSATTSIASIKSTQATQATQISAMAKTQTDMTASLNSQSASIQTLQEAVSNNDALNSTWMVKMQTNNNGQKYAAGIALGVDGKNMQSQFLVQADRFALINTSNGNTTTPFVIDNGVTYMNAAYIKDGSIGSAKVGDLMSSGFQENVRGWRISRDGTMNINGSGPGSSRTVITNGKIEVYDSNNRLRVRMGIF
ncbi:phage tail tip fiber protein [Klebsiella quasipneumoniae]|uniref:phage tail tip fiber protein n=1 Tax=Klebsiella quasipneumoniae TaxID=1463165 RepID=UPI0029D42B3D|nr:phage tail protein [Klebsiella quasipneumoniae]MDX7659684.1 phage tail protein [Klebsiella quasipneumoniae]